MKKNLAISIAYVVLISVFISSPLYSSGNGDEQTTEPGNTVSAEEVAVEESTAKEVADQEMSPLSIRLQQLGFAVPEGSLPLIDFELPNLDGVTEKLSDYKGQFIFLNFWATWCGPCQSEMPDMENVYNELKDQGFTIVAVDLGEDSSTVQTFVDELSLTFPVLLDETGGVGSMYNAQSIPTTYLINREGNILGRAIGVRPWEEEAYMDLFRDLLNM